MIKTYNAQQFLNIKVNNPVIKLFFAFIKTGFQIRYLFRIIFECEIKTTHIFYKAIYYYK